MRLVFAGTPQFAAIQLRALCTAGHKVTLVLTQPDRPSGRGLHQTASAVKQAAVEAGLEVQQPVSLKNFEVQEALAREPADAWVVAAYGLMLPPLILRSPRFGCINVHASLLPRWRGAAPIQRAIMAGDSATGVSIMQMDAGLDTGPVYLQRSIPIGDTDTAASVHDRLAHVAAQALLEVLDGLSKGTITAHPQSSVGIEYAAKLTPRDSKIDWTRSAESVARIIHALNPTPGAVTLFRGQPVKLWRAVVQDSAGAAAPGTIVHVSSSGFRVACGQGTLSVTELQRAGGKRLSAAEFLRGFTLQVGEQFGA